VEIFGDNIRGTKPEQRNCFDVQLGNGTIFKSYSITYIHSIGYIHANICHHNTYIQKCGNTNRSRLRLLNSVLAFSGMTALLICTSDGNLVPRVAAPMSKSGPNLNTTALQLEKQVLKQLEKEFGPDAHMGFTPFHRLGASVHDESLVKGLDAAERLPDLIWGKNPLPPNVPRANSSVPETCSSPAVEPRSVPSIQCQGK